MQAEQLFELFYQDITPEMNPPGIQKYRCDGMYQWWYERFMNAFYGLEEPRALRSWAEVPQMWLRGYKRANQK